MRRAAIFLSLACLVTGLWAEDPQTFSIGGTATNAVTGELLRRTVVRLQISQELTATADAGGHFSFPALPSGTYSIWAEKQGFAPAQKQRVSVGPSREDLKLELTPFGRITGKITDENGDPLIHASVQAFRSSLFNGRRQIAPAGNASTNDLGEFRMSTLPPGRFFVSASMPVQTDGPGYPRTFYGGTTEISSAAPVELRAGENTAVTIALQPVPEFRVTGKIISLEAGQRPSVGLRRKGLPFAANQGYVQMNPASGEFEFRGVTPGVYLLNAVIFGPGAQLSAATEVVVSNSDVVGVTLSPSRTPDLTGVLRADPAGTDLRGISITAKPSGDGGQAFMGALVKEDGSFAFPSLQPGDYTLGVRVNEPRYLKSVMLGGRDVGSESFTVTSSGAAGSLEVVIATGGGQLEGTVTDGNAQAANVPILLLGKGQERAAMTDSVGGFKFTALPPGDYTAYALVDIQEVEYMNPEVMRRYSGSRVTIPDSGSQRVELKLNRTVY